jgi:anti-sigma28 factor (negative regulator of flagellin synthesis)
VVAGVVIGHIVSSGSLQATIREQQLEAKRAQEEATSLLRTEAEKLARFKQEIASGDLTPILAELRKQAREDLTREITLASKELRENEVEKLRKTLAEGSGDKDAYPSDIRVYVWDNPNDSIGINAWLSENKGKVQVISLIPVQDYRMWIVYRNVE